MEIGKLICKSCGKESTYGINRERGFCRCCHQTIPERPVAADRKRVRDVLCYACFRDSMRLQMEDELLGYLGNHDWYGENNLVAMAKDSGIKQWASYFQVTEYMIFHALKRMQKEDKLLLDMEDGDVDMLER